MLGTETGKDKVKKICDILRRETLDPALNEADQIIQSAKDQAERIVAEGQRQADALLDDAKAEIERQKNVFQSSLSQACSQALSALKQGIEQKLFDQQLGQLLTKHTQDPKVLAHLIEAVVKGLEKEGIDAVLSVYVPAAVPASSVNLLLGQELLEKLKEKSVLVGPLSGGIEVKLHKQNITVDISDAALKELVAGYCRKDFRDLIFGAL